MLDVVSHTGSGEACFRHLLEHDQYAPSDGPLLSPDQSTALTRGSEFGNVDRNLSGADTHTNTIDEPANDEHANVL